MKSSATTGGATAYPSQYNNLRDDAYGGSQLLVHQVATPGMTVYVEPGTFFLGPTKVVFAGGSSPTVTAPSANPRIDILTIDSTGTLAFTTGTEGATPIAPTYPTTEVVVAEIYNVVGEVLIYDNANQTSGQGYITDVRPFMQLPSTPGTAVNNTSTYALNTGYTNTSGRTQFHMVTVQLTSINGDVVFVTVNANDLIGQSYLNNSYSLSVTEKRVLTFIVADGGYFSIVTGGTGTTPTLFEWYTLNI